MNIRPEDHPGPVSRANVEAAQRIYAARRRGDVDGLLAELHPDVEWRPHLSSLGGRVSGVELQPQVGHVLRFKDGKCIESVTYLDRAEALEAAGLR